MYKSMGAVARFGRTAKFDYLAMLGKLALAEIEPDSAYVIDATGPLIGARLLFGGSRQSALSARILDAWLVDLDSFLMVGMQPLEDAICNWQKSSTVFKGFRG
jgi:hypothetical protein